MPGPEVTTSEGATRERALLVKRAGKLWTVVINRVERRNAIDGALLDELSRLLDEAESDRVCKMIVLEGREGIFCTGMDFEAVAREFASGELSQDEASRYMAVIKRFTSIPKVIVAKVEGQVLAGGVGCVAASDLVVSNRSSQFCLSEALWGLLPACVTPFLIRRVGFQKAYKMTLTTETIDAAEAWRIGLVDILSDDCDDEVRRLLLRVGRLEEQTIRDLKQYFRRMWLIDDAVEHEAITEMARLFNTPRVRQNIKNYVELRRFPWET